ncbi:MAG: N-acetyltransferase [Deltaproteobacteria bacterium]|nr:N-acetyltransferase [Deltaproteobacteria bacterium]
MSDFFVHETAFVDQGADIGEGTRIWHYSHVMKGAKVGKNCIIGQNVFIGPGAVIGDGSKIQNNVSVYQGVVLEQDVFCGPSMVFTNVLTPRAHVERKEEFLETRVRKGATLGANSTIVCGNVIGEYSMVAAGATVTRDVQPHSLVMGTPARHAGWVCTCGERLHPGSDKTYECLRCKSRFREESGVLVAL